MTDQPYTPTATQIREDYAHLRYHFADGWSIGEERVQFDNWLSAEIAAAEQRGAIKALRDAATDIEKNNIVFDGDHYQPCNSCMSIHMNWLDYRADRIANKENE